MFSNSGSVGSSLFLDFIFRSTSVVFIFFIKSTCKGFVFFTIKSRLSTLSFFFCISNQEILVRASISMNQIGKINFQSIQNAAETL